MRVALLASLALLTSGCSVLCLGVTCELACPPAIELVVVDSTNGSAVPGVTVSGGDFACAVDGSQNRCTSNQEAPGHYELTVSAPGYVPQAVVVDVPENEPTGGQCCACGYVPQTASLQLARES